MERYPRFFVERTKIIHPHIFIEDDQVSHIYKSLRLKSGDKIIIFDGEENKFQAEIITSAKKFIELKKEDRLEIKTPKFNLVIGLSLPRINKVDDLIDNLNQLNVTEFVPIISRYSNAYEKDFFRKKDRFKKIAIESCKQSERDLPIRIHDPIKIDSLNEITKEFDLKIIATTKSVDLITQDLFKQEYKSVFTLLGPEGDFTKEEVAQLQSEGYKSVSFGQTILRTELAPVYLASVVKYIYER